MNIKHMEDSKFKFFTIKNYRCDVKAVEVMTPLPVNKKKRRWVFVIQFLDSEVDDEQNTNIIEIPSLESFKTPEDALQDAFGIVELFGFRISRDVNRLKMTILDWNAEKKEYELRYLYFDGYDFFTIDSDV